MQPVYLERCDQRRNISRFYEVGVEATLFGDWAVVRRWGRIGTYGRTCHEWFSSLPEAQFAHDLKVNSKRQRGYSPLLIEIRATKNGCCSRVSAGGAALAA